MEVPELRGNGPGMPARDANGGTFPSREEWKAFRGSLESLLESQFLKQECLIQRCFERLSPGLAGPILEFAATAPTSCSRTPERGSVPRLRMQGMREFTVSSLTSSGTHATGSTHDGPGTTEDHNFDGPSPAASRSASKRSSERGSINNLRLPKRASEYRLNWDLSVQDRESAKELRSQTARDLKRQTLKERFHTFTEQWFDWWMSLEEPERHGCLTRAVLSRKFEAICALVILANAFFAAYTTNYEIQHLQEESTPAVDVVEWCFLGFYLVELILKFCVHRLFFFCNDDMCFNIFDLCLVVSSLYYQVSISLMTSGGIDLTYMRTLRILKLARILRVIRMARFFMELRLMLNSVLGSFISLFWAFMMLLMVFYIFGLVFVQGATTYLIQHGEELDSGMQYKVDRAFGSVQRAMFSLYKVSTNGASWETLFDSPLIESMGWLHVALFILLVAFVQVALLNILREAKYSEYEKSYPMGHKFFALVVRSAKLKPGARRTLAHAYACCQRWGTWRAMSRSECRGNWQEAWRWPARLCWWRSLKEADREAVKKELEAAAAEGGFPAQGQEDWGRIMSAAR